MTMHEHYLPVVVAALTVLLLGAWNPPMLQKMDKSGHPTGHPSYLWMSLLALLFGGVAVAVFNKSARPKM